MSLLILMIGCDDDSEGASPASDAGVASRADADPGCPLDCGGHGRCVNTPDGLFDCECDPGFEARSLTCIDPGVSAPPAEFSCPTPGDISGPEATRFSSQGWAYKRNTRDCSTDPGGEIYRFRPDGIFTLHRQSRADEVGGQLLYGCWSLESEADAQVNLRFDYPEGLFEMYNCGIPAYSMDPPCVGALRYDEAHGGYLSPDALDDGELRVLFPVPEACVWCNDQADCCPNNSWLEANGEALCQ